MILEEHNDENGYHCWPHHWAKRTFQGHELHGIVAIESRPPGSCITAGWGIHLIGCIYAPIFTTQSDVRATWEYSRRGDWQQFGSRLKIVSWFPFFGKNTSQTKKHQDMNRNRLEFTSYVLYFAYFSEATHAAILCIFSCSKNKRKNSK